jgi:hypothetical protein
LLRSRYSGLIVGLILLGFYIWNQQRDLSNYESPGTASSQIKFTEASDELGLNFFYHNYFPNKKRRHLSQLVSYFPALAIVDFNNDGFMDIYLVQSHPKKKNKLFQNIDGKIFRDVAAQYGLANLNEQSGSSRPLFMDLNGDNLKDLVLLKFGCHEIYLNQGIDKPFVKLKNPFQNYCSNAVAGNFFDYNKDGKIDILVGNYWPDEDLKTFFPMSPNVKTNRIRQPAGANVLLESQGQLKFKKKGDEIGLTSRSYTNAIGFSYIDSDFYPDVFIANDYGFDEMLLNKDGKSFLDVTETYIPKRFHGMNGMNSDFADFDQDGMIDLYVTNIHHPPFNSFNNVLWKKKKSGFEAISHRLKVAKCGWSWSGKFADFDNDGDLDLIVSTGRARGKKAHSKKDSNSFWYQRSLRQSVPRWLKKFDKTIDYSGFATYQISSFERNCLFENKGTEFKDIAVGAGITDLEDGYGLGLIDFNNDGKLDFVITNLSGPALLYKNNSDTPGSWVGFSLFAPNNEALAIGARIVIKTKSGRAFVKENFPANGFNSQSDPRLHFGLKNEQLQYVSVKWSDSKEEIYEDIQLNKYQTLIKGQGRHVQ